MSDTPWDDSDWEPSDDDAPDAAPVNAPRKVIDMATKEPVQPKVKSTLTSLGSTLTPALERARRRKEGKEKPVPVPFPQYSEALKGGFWPGVHSVVAGTGAGKSTFMFQIATHAARQGVPVLYIGLELGEFQVALRAMGDSSGVNWSALYTGQASEEQLSKAESAIPDMMSLPFYVEYNSEQGWAPSNLLKRAAEIREQHPTGPMLIVLDFLQLVGAEAAENGRMPDLRERIARAAYAAVHVANKHSASVVLISSTSRANYGKFGGGAETDMKNFITREVPGLYKRQRTLQSPDALVGAGKESGEIEYAVESQTVLVKWPVKLETGESVVLCAVPKIRYAMSSWVPMSFWHRYAELPFESLEDLPGADQMAKPGRPKVTDDELEEAVVEAVQAARPGSSKTAIVRGMKGTYANNLKAFERAVQHQRITDDEFGYVVRTDKV